MIAKTFRSVDEFIDQIYEAIKKRTTIPDPATVAELQAAVDEFPDLAYRWRPAPDIAKRYGLPTCRPVKPLDDEVQRAFIETITSDDSFRTCLRLATVNEGAV